MLNLKSITFADAPSSADFMRDILMADWACYTTPEDRADKARLEAAITAFPEGFRLYSSADGEPVGYTGWYPIASDVFNRLYDAPQNFTHRGQIMPLPALTPGGDYLYLFNYSIISTLHKTPESRAFMHSFVRAVRGTPHRGLAAVTVSPDGVRVAEKFDMSYRGDMTHDGVAEGVYALRLY